MNSKNKKEDRVMKLVRFSNPFFPVNGDLVDELFDNFLRNDYHENYLLNSQRPATNIFETAKDFRIEVLLPGFAKEDVQMNFHKDLLTIKVDKELKDEGTEYMYAHREFGPFNFEKQFQIPKTVDAEKISARFENGVLTVVLPKKEEAVEKKPLEIKIS